MKSLLIGLMLIAVASAAGKPARKRDVNEILDSGAGWTKGADGYKYDIPATPLKADPIPEVVEVVPEVVPEEIPEVVQDVVEVVAEPIAEEPAVEEVVVADVPTVSNDYLPPNEYLPPARRRLRLRRRYRLVRRQ